MSIPIGPKSVAATGTAPGREAMIAKNGQTRIVVLPRLNRPRTVLDKNPAGLRNERQIQLRNKGLIRRQNGAARVIEKGDEINAAPNGEI